MIVCYEQKHYSTLINNVYTVQSRVISCIHEPVFMRTKWSGTVSQDAVLIKLRRRLKLILSSWPVHKKEKEGGYEKEGKRKGRRKKKTGEKWAHPHLSIIKRERQRKFIWERKSARKEVSTTYLRFFMRSIRGEVNCTAPAPPPQKKKSPKLLPLSLMLKNTTTTTFTLFSVFEHWQCLPPPPPSPFPFRCNVGIHTIMISLF